MEINNPAVESAAQIESGASTSQTPATAGSSTPSPGAAQTVAAPAGGAQGVSQGAASSAQTPAQQSATVREVLRGLGLDLGNQFQDDHSALQHLAGAYRQNTDLRQLAQYGQQYLTHADKFQAYLRTQQEEQARQQQQAQQSWWKAPEYDPSWINKLVRDPQTGALRVVDGADPAIAQKYMAWVDHQRGFMDKFAQNPIEAIKPGLEQLVQDLAQKQIQQHLGGYREQQQAHGLIQKNAEWMFERDAGGNQVAGQNGQPVLSEWGRRYAQYAQQAERMGISSVQGQHDTAMAYVQRDFAVQRLSEQQQGQTSQAQGDAAKQQFLANAQAQHRPNVGAAQAAGVNGATNSPPAQTLMNPRGLADLMLKNLAANGFAAGQRIM